MIIVRPNGTLTVTYELREAQKACPRCAEMVMPAALVCRFCGFEFPPAPLTDTTSVDDGSTEPLEKRLPNWVRRGAQAIGLALVAIVSVLAWNQPSDIGGTVGTEHTSMPHADAKMQEKTGSVAVADANPALGACVDVNTVGSFVFEGTLTFHIFAGPPNYESVSHGDTPEPAYILKLDAPICVTGDDDTDPKTAIEQIQIWRPSDAGDRERLERDLRRLVGQRVRAEGKKPFGAITGHHHAPLLLPATRIQSAFDPTEAYGTPLMTVRAFYLALAAGNGDEAASFVTPEKRASGPLSASAMTAFYGNLNEPLTLVDVLPIRPNEYRARYTFVARGAKRCDGIAIVRTTQIGSENFISSINAVNGC